jgi:hypothetical protein
VKPRTAEELIAWARSGYPDDLNDLEAWNAGAEWADAHWADRPVREETNRAERRMVYGPENLPKRSL